MIMLAMGITSMLVHGYLTQNMISSVIVPVIKDKCGKITCKDNYRPIAISSIFTKVLEKLLFTRMEEYICTASNQFGFKKGLGTDMCIFSLKEMI